MGYSKTATLFATFCVAFAILPYSANSQRQIDPEIQHKIDEYIVNFFLPASNISSFGLTVVQNNGEVLYTAGFGLADVEKEIPVGNDTQFLVASLTKSFTSVTIAEFLNQKFPELGEAVLDTPIRQLVPEANFTLIDRYRSEHATFRDLLAHRLCISTDDLPLNAEPFNTTAEIVYRQRYSEEVCGMRAGPTYSNSMYTAAGELVGILAGRPYEELAKDLLARIGMTGSAFANTTDDYSQMPHRAQPYYNRDNVSYPMNPDLVTRIVFGRPGGGLFITPNDMAKYMNFHLNQGMVDGTQIVAKEVMEWLVKPSQLLPMVESKNFESEKVLNRFAGGLGLVLGSYDGWQLLQHSGHWATYANLMSMFPGKGLGIFTTTNQGPVMGDELALHLFIFDVMRGMEDEEKAKDLLLQEKLRKETENEKNKEALKKAISSFKSKGNGKNVEEIVGKYGSGNQGDLELSEEFNSETNSTGIYLNYGKWMKGWLENVGGDLYQIIWDSDIVQELYAGGNVDATNYALIANETFEFVMPFEDMFIYFGKFMLGVSLDILPPIPWAPDSC